MRYLFTSMAVACAFTAWAQSVEITVANPANFNRTEEIVEVNEADVKGPLGVIDFVITDNEGKEVPWQATHDGKIIFPASVKAGSTATYKVSPGTPAPVPVKVYGRLFPERIDDLTWENDRMAYRAYGPALQRTGERAFGYDVWCKCVPEPVLEKRYTKSRHGISFHKDHGDGMDVYAVGPSLGGGTSALLDENGEIIYPWCFTDYTIIDNGPLRFKVKLDYPPMTAEKGVPAHETRIITLDAGEWVNKCEVTYSGLSKPTEMVAGQVVHKQNPDAYVLDPENCITAYADLTQNATEGNGTIFVGQIAGTPMSPAYLPSAIPAGDAIGHTVLRTTANENEPIVYYWGSGWSKGGMENIDKWMKTLRHKKQCLDTPLEVTVK